jgi:hypothetical protein
MNAGSACLNHIALEEESNTGAWRFDITYKYDD